MRRTSQRLIVKYYIIFNCVVTAIQEIDSVHSFLSPVPELALYMLSQSHD